MQSIRSLIRDVPDFPKPGIIFRDITPALEDPSAFAQIVDAFAERFAEAGATKIAGIESRGFIFSAALAYRMGCGLVLVRKRGKLPRETFSASYALEYGEDTLEVHQDALDATDRVVLLDDVIATGGTARAATELVRKSGAEVAAFGALIELVALGGRAQLDGVALHALLTY